METDRFISLIQPSVREYIDHVATEETGDVPNSVIAECEMVDSGNSKFGKTFSFDTRIVPHPSRNMTQHGYRDISSDAFSDAAEEIVADLDISRPFPSLNEEFDHDFLDPEIQQWNQKLLEFAWKVMDYEGDFRYSDDAFLTALTDHLLVDSDDTYLVLVPLLNVISNIDNVPLDVAESAVHPHENEPFIIQNLRVERFSDAALSAILTYEGFLSAPAQDLYASSGMSFNHPSHYLLIEFDGLYDTTFGLRSSNTDNSVVSRPLLEKAIETADRVLAAMRLDDPLAYPVAGQAYIVNRDWRTYRDDINSIDLHRPWTARYDPVLWNSHLIGSNYTVDEQSADHLQRFWKRYASNISFDDGAPFKRSLSRFNEIYGRSSPKDQLVDAVIVFEGVLQKGVEIGGLGTTMALIGSILLDSRTGRSRKELRSFFRSLYHTRSEIVHNDAQWDFIIDSDDFDPVGNDNPSIHEFVEETRGVVSETILAYMDQRARNDRSIGDTNTLIYNAMRDAGSPNLGLERDSRGVSRQVFGLPSDTAELVQLVAD
jgi:hypothetical protein